MHSDRKKRSSSFLRPRCYFQPMDFKEIANFVVKLPKFAVKPLTSDMGIKGEKICVIQILAVQLEHVFCKLFQGWAECHVLV